MLGVGSGAGRSGKIRRIVKDGLQAWYKADVTQAPLGEEEIANGDFAASSNLLPDTNDLNSWTNSQHAEQVADGVKIKFSSSQSPSTHGYIQRTEANWGDYIHGDNYLVKATVTGGSGSTGKKFRIQDHTSNSGGLVLADTETTMTEGVSQSVEFLFTPNSSSNTLVLSRHTNTGSDYEFTVNSLTLQKVNPNSSWTSSVSSGATVSFEDGKVDIVTDGAAAELKQTGIFTIGKKYQVTINATINSGAGVKVGDGSDDDLIINNISSTGVYTAEFTATHADFEIAREGSSASSSTINSVSVKEITNSVRDYSSNKNNAVLYSGTALDFDGDATNPDYVTLDYPVAGTVVDSNFKCTIACWFNAATLGAKMIFGTNQDGAGNNRLYLWTESNKLYFNWGDQSGSVTTGSVPDVVADRWYRAVIVLNGLTAYVYLDGELQYTRTSGAFNPSDFTNNLTIGRDGDDDNYEYDGMVSDFQVYDACWTPSDVKYDWDNPDGDVFDNENRAQRLGDNLQLNDFTTSISTGTTWSTQNSTAGVSDGIITVTTNGADYWGQAYLGTGNAIFEVGSYYVISGAIRNVDSVNGVAVEWVDRTGSQTRISNGGVKYTGTDWVNFTSEPVQALETFASQLKLNVWNPNDGSTPVNSGQFKDIVIKKVLDHKAEIKPYNCKTLLRLNEGAGTRLYDAAPVLGGELVANGDFATDLSGWTISNNDSTHTITYSNGSARYQSDSVSPQLNFDQTISDVVVGRTYQVSIDVTNTTGTVKLVSIDANGVVLTEGLNTFNVVASTNTVRITRADTTVDVLINSISLKEITLSDSFLYVDGDNDTAEWKTAQPYIPQLAMSSYSKKLVFTDIDTDVDIGAQSIADDQAFSFSFWYAQTDDSSLENYILAKHDSTDDYIRFNNQNESLEFKVNGGTAITYNIGDLTDFKISHIVLTRASGANPTTKCYVNGTLEVTDTTSNADGVFEYQQIGAGGTSNAGTFFLDELAHFSKELSSAEIQEIFNAGTALDVRDHSASSDLIGYWRNNGIDTWTDLSTNSNNGTVNGSPTTIQLQEVPYFKKDTLGLPMNRVRERGLNLDGSSYLKVDDSDDFNVASTNAISVEAWVKRKDEYANSRYIICNAAYSDDDGFTLLSNNTNFVFTTETGSDKEVVAAHSDSSNWFHVVATYDETTYKIYINGSKGTDVAATEAMVDLSSDIFIGALTDGSLGWQGIIDDIKFYNKALSQAEVTNNYKKGLATHKNTSTWSDDFDSSFV